MKKISVVPFRPIQEYAFLDDFWLTAGLEHPWGLFTPGSLHKGMYGVHMKNLDIIQTTRSEQPLNKER